MNNKPDTTADQKVRWRPSVRHVDDDSSCLTPADEKEDTESSASTWFIMMVVVVCLEISASWWYIEMHFVGSPCFSLLLASSFVPLMNSTMLKYPDPCSHCQKWENVKVTWVSTQPISL